MAVPSGNCSTPCGGIDSFIELKLGRVWNFKDVPAS